MRNWKYISLSLGYFATYVSFNEELKVVLIASAIAKSKTLVSFNEELKVSTLCAWTTQIQSVSFNEELKDLHK